MDPRMPRGWARECCVWWCPVAISVPNLSWADEIRHAECCYTCVWAQILCLTSWNLLGSLESLINVWRPCTQGCQKVMDPRMPRGWARECCVRCCPVAISVPNLCWADEIRHAECCYACVWTQILCLTSWISETQKSLKPLESLKPLGTLEPLKPLESRRYLNNFHRNDGAKGTSRIAPALNREEPVFVIDLGKFFNHSIVFIVYYCKLCRNKIAK